MSDIQGLSPEELNLAAAICINIAFLARKFYSSNTLDVVNAFSEFYDGHPNATEQDILAFSGARLTDLKILESIVGGSDGIKESVDWVTTISSSLPRTAGTGSHLIPVFWVFFILTTAVLALRLWSRQSIAGGIRTYDWIMVVGYLLTVAHGSTALYHATGINTISQFWGYTWDQIALQQSIYMSLDVLYPCAALAIKSSLLLFYYSLSPARYLKISVWVTFVFALATALAASGYSLFKCSPVAYWTEWYTSVCSTNQTIPYVVTGAAMILADIIIWVMPLPMVMSLQLYRRERVAAVFTFSLGIL
ncbi:hypothetical protein DRE_00905 [Drechslerella stenobrocha 248]|uniref:Rhodopsin domain-containing protein n=1 Tax=Drechslerella stenobrocha 248 TaxID=1043628 RepID=W7HLH0_9PEZI|nr:hypothetical protein DRE_00905 [Drechslerella stenobrocha 248]